MKPLHVWIIGSGGLLGSELRRTMSEELANGVLWQPEVAFSWNDESIHGQLNDACRAFANTVKQSNGSWMVLWAAGAAVVSSSEEVLRYETGLFGECLELFGEHLCATQCPGAVFLASSAGGVYGNSTEVLSEDSPCHPVSEYGRYKLEQERLLQMFSDRWPSVRSLAGRITNLYGPTQNLKKSQGLISRLSNCIIRRTAISMFVPLDTVRDYLYGEDCARLVWRSLRICLEDQRMAKHTVKVLASERVTTIAEILGAFTHLARRHPLVVHRRTAESEKQPPSLRYASTICKQAALDAPTPLLVGIARVHDHQRFLHQQGRLPETPLIG